jgi:hypothetical protein
LDYDSDNIPIPPYGDKNELPQNREQAITLFDKAEHTIHLLNMLKPDYRQHMKLGDASHTRFLYETQHPEKSASIGTGLT